jgi:hypothetical protein
LASLEGFIVILDDGLVLLQRLLANLLLAEVVGRQDMENLLELLLVEVVKRIQVPWGQVQARRHTPEAEAHWAKTE